VARQLAAQQGHVAALTRQHDRAVAMAALALQRQAMELEWASIRATTSNWPEATLLQGRTAVAWAKKQLGVPYSWGGGNADGPTLGTAENKHNTSGAYTVGFDCSGLTLYAWAHAGFTLDHYTGYQWLEGRQVSLDALRAGDLVFFAKDVSDPSTIHHVGIYVGGGRMIDAPHTGAVVRYDDVFVPGLIGAVRP
jgi:cell wall-associated NlpC family hydrolase